MQLHTSQFTNGLQHNAYIVIPDHCQVSLALKMSPLAAVLFTYMWDYSSAIYLKFQYFPFVDCYTRIRACLMVT